MKALALSLPCRLGEEKVMSTDPLPRILVIDDELAICQNCVKILSKTACEVEFALSGDDALRLLAEKPFDLVITDLKMSRLGGMEVLRQVKEVYPEIVIIVITGYASISSAVEVMKMGAFDYLPKPFTPDERRSIVRQGLLKREIRVQNKKLRLQKDNRARVSHQLIGNSQRINKVVNMIRKVAPTDSTVLIYGESGTGKELVARALHANSKRKDQVFFAVDCGTLSGNLLESELFGYTKGAFTGANKDKDGIFQLAHNGTVFLDEINNVSWEVQGKLLRFLDSRITCWRATVTGLKWIRPVSWSQSMRSSAASARVASAAARKAAQRSRAECAASSASRVFVGWTLRFRRGD